MTNQCDSPGAMSIPKRPEILLRPGSDFLSQVGPKEYSTGHLKLDLERILCAFGASQFAPVGLFPAVEIRY